MGLFGIGGGVLGSILGGPVGGAIGGGLGSFLDSRKAASDFKNSDPFMGLNPSLLAATGQAGVLPGIGNLALGRYGIQAGVKNAGTGGVGGGLFGGFNDPSGQASAGQAAQATDPTGGIMSGGKIDLPSLLKKYNIYDLLHMTGGGAGLSTGAGYSPTAAGLGG